MSRSAVSLAVLCACVALLLEVTRPPLLIVGNVTHDVVDGTLAIGGAVSYAAAVAAAFGIRSCLVTTATAAETGGVNLFDMFAGHDLHIVGSNATLTFAHSYTFWGNHRKLRVTAQPNVTLSARHVPQRCRRARTVLLGPLTPDDVDVSSFVRPPSSWIDRVTHSHARIGLLAQGLQRSLDGAGRVSALEEPSRELQSALGPDVAVFLSDVETEKWGNGTLESLAEGLGAHLVVTLGAEGADELRRGRRQRHAPFQVDAVLDTNGAGDSFAAAYMLALARNHPNPAAVANWAGGLAVNQPQGCKPGCITLGMQRNWHTMPQPQPGRAELISRQEKQHLQQCLRHAINNLAQRPAVSSAQLAAIADSLAPGKLPLPLLHPHRTILLGNYDVNVLECALRDMLGQELRWHDQRDATFEQLDLATCVGIIVNVRAEGWWTLFFPGRHWFALRRVGDAWYSLDSRLDAPQPVGLLLDGGGPAASDEAAVRRYLKQQVEKLDAKVFSVVDMHPR